VDDFPLLNAQDEDIQREILLDNNISASRVRLEIFKPDNGEMPDFNPFESSLHALYTLGDQIYQALGQHPAPYLWARIRL
jgi:hypothetical protein